MFNDRKDAGQRLAQALIKYKNNNVLVLAIPMGGIEVGYYVAEKLGAPFSVIVVRKLPFPQNPEAGFGAVAEDGGLFLLNNFDFGINPSLVKEIIERQKIEIKRRIEILRDGNPLPELIDKTVILVDDGIAIGSTMRASVRLCKNKKAKSIIVATPVGGPEIAKKLVEISDDVVILEQPDIYRAVAQVYRQWHDVSDEEAVKLIKRSDKFISGKNVLK